LRLPKTFRELAPHPIAAKGSDWVGSESISGILVA